MEDRISIKKNSSLKNLQKYSTTFYMIFIFLYKE